MNELLATFIWGREIFPARNLPKKSSVTETWVDISVN